MNVKFQAATIARGGAPIFLTKVRQRFERPLVKNLEGTVRAEMARSGVSFHGNIALAVGSRGIANLAPIVRSVVSVIREADAKPFIVPAMGSHGGATAEGQRALLGSLTVTEDNIGCPVLSSMEVIELPANGLEHPLYMDRHASGADGIVLINRVKPHTDFHGRYESGLAKMAVIGLGKEKQAFALHQFGVRGLRALVPKAAERVLATGKVLLGLAIVENAYDETALIEAVPASRILEREPELLEIAQRNMPRLPVDDLDLLIVDRLGKNISGTGMDTNIIGRMRIRDEPEPAAPRIKSIVVTSVTPESHGNATGTGLADVITQRLLEQTDFGATYTNIVTSGFLERAKLPIVAENDEAAVRIALRGAGQGERIIRIRDTLHLEEIFVSDAVLREAPGLERIGKRAEAFTQEGALREF